MGAYKPLWAELEDLKLADDELDPEEEADLEEAATYHNEYWLPYAPPPPPMAFPLVPAGQKDSGKGEIEVCKLVRDPITKN